MAKRPSPVGQPAKVELTVKLVVRREVAGRLTAHAILDHVLQIHTAGEPVAFMRQHGRDRGAAAGGLHLHDAEVELVDHVAQGDDRQHERPPAPPHPSVRFLTARSRPGRMTRQHQPSCTRTGDTGGTVANLIVVEQARSSGIEIGSLDYAKVGVPSTLLTLLSGLADPRLHAGLTRGEGVRHPCRSVSTLGLEA